MMNDKALPKRVCDIVLKGGITSGIVYPLALVRLAEKYRFSCIGGTSAGAIAAAVCAAAEYGRRNGHDGFAHLKALPDEMGTKLIKLFQPTPVLKPTFEIFIGTLTAKTKLALVLATLRAVFTGYRVWAVASVAPGVALIIAALKENNLATFLLGVLIALIGFLGVVAWRLAKALFAELVANDYGLCPGIRQPYAKLEDEGFTDWLARLIDEAAGPRKTNDPLTFGDLASVQDTDAPIKLAMMTTSLMEKRPYTLPMHASHHKPKAPAGAGPEPTGDHTSFVFEKSELEKLFPARIVAYLIAHCDRFEQEHGEPGEFYYFPDETHLPLVVAARMSLSFPGLICAVPLWRRDFTLLGEAEKQTLRRCLFSDGGLSSNFPIQFFDHLLPNHPTFAITLDEFSDKRNSTPVWLPRTDRASSGSGIPIMPFQGLPASAIRQKTGRTACRAYCPAIASALSMSA
jgi:hypothetical protein